MTDSRLVTINQMILAVIFGVGVIGFLFVMLLVPSKELNAVAVTMISNLLSVLGTVVVMQNTHFFKSALPDTPGTPGVVPLVPVTGDPPHVETQINAQTVYHGGSMPPVNPVP